MLKNKAVFTRFFAALMLCSFVISIFSGCTTLRRKFVRKSKVKDEASGVIPVLEPVEYAAVSHAPAQKYAEQYSLFRAFYKDVWDVVGESQGDKRERYVLTQAAAKIDAMADLLVDEKSRDLKKYSQRIFELFKELDKPSPMRRYDLIKSELRAVENGVRKDFKPSMAEPFFVKDENFSAKFVPSKSGAGEGKASGK